MSDSEPVLIPAGTTFLPGDLIHYWAPHKRSFEEALADADVVVTGPHSGVGIPAELGPFLAPEFTKRLQLDFSDLTAGEVATRWAAIDPRVIYLENPHHRLVRDSNRPQPVELRAALRQAFERIGDAGSDGSAEAGSVGDARSVERARSAHEAQSASWPDLTGVDAVRPITLGGSPVLRPPKSERELSALAEAFHAAALQGVAVYENTRDDLIDRLVAVKLEQAERRGDPTLMTVLSLHDEISQFAGPDGAVTVTRHNASRRPPVLSLSNRGDHNGDNIGRGSITMRAKSFRQLGHGFRSGFHTLDSDDVVLNQSALSSHESMVVAEKLRTYGVQAAIVGLELSAAQLEFDRDYLLGSAGTAELQRPGTGWVESDDNWLNRVATFCKSSLDIYRALKSSV